MPEFQDGPVGEFRFRGSGGSDQAGQGIGLWVTRQLTEAMGGAFRVESQMGEGSAFYLGFAASPARLDPRKVQVRSEP